MFLSLDGTYTHPLLLHAMQLARTSVSTPTQKSYISSWRKWERFYQQYFRCLPADQYYRTLTRSQFLELLLMFVSYCVFELRCNVRSIPRIMSAVRYAFVVRLVDSTAFDDPLLRTVKQGVANMPAPPQRVRMPCTLDMVNHIIKLNTTQTATINNLMLATGVEL